MFPPIFAIASADSSVQAIIGGGGPDDPVRLWPFAEAPRDEQGNVAHGVPYAVWQLITGTPANYLGNTPDVDTYGVQIDCYSESVSVSRELAQALRDCLEPHGYVTSWNGEWRDQPTGLFRITFSMEFITTRTES
jgi:hypothetical protein